MLFWGFLLLWCLWCPIMGHPPLARIQRPFLQIQNKQGNQDKMGTLTAPNDCVLFLNQKEDHGILCNAEDGGGCYISSRSMSLGVCLLEKMPQKGNPILCSLFPFSVVNCRYIVLEDCGPHRKRDRNWWVVLDWVSTILARTRSICTYWLWNTNCNFADSAYESNAHIYN